MTHSFHSHIVQGPDDATLFLKLPYKFRAISLRLLLSENIESLEKLVGKYKDYFWIQNG